jgi:outer membrane protein with glycine zipper
MARSHHRHKKHHHPQYRQPVTPSKAKRKGGAWVFITFFAAFGLGIGYFAAGTIVAIIIGAVVGALIGYLIGHNLDRMESRK